MCRDPDLDYDSDRAPRDAATHLIQGFRSTEPDDRKQRSEPGLGVIGNTPKSGFFFAYGATPVTVQAWLSVSPDGAKGGWLNGAGVTSSATSVKMLCPSVAGYWGMFWVQVLL